MLTLLAMQVRKDSGGATFRYMPVWGIDELEACRSSCYPDIAPDAVQANYASFGGSARFVLSSFDHTAELELALESYDIELAIKAVTAGGGGSGDFCHRLVHMFPTEDFQYYSVGFASQQVWHSVPLWGEALIDRQWLAYVHWFASTLSVQICEQMLDKFQGNMLSKASEFLTAHSNEKLFAAAVGHVYEAVAHRRLQQGGKFDRRRLVPAGTTEGSEEVEWPERPLRSFKCVSELSVGEYGIPWSGNAAGIDAVCKPNVLLQMKSGQGDGARKVSAKAVADVIGKLPVAPGGGVEFYFVVPPKRFMECTTPAIWLGARHNPLKRLPGELKGVRQYALRVDWCTTWDTGSHQFQQQGLPRMNRQVSPHDS